MKLEEVLPAFKEGKKIRRAAWINWAIRLKDGNAIVVFDHKIQWVDAADKTVELTMDKILSNDWEVVE